MLVFYGIMLWVVAILLPIIPLYKWMIEELKLYIACISVFELFEIIVLMILWSKIG